MNRHDKGPGTPSTTTYYLVVATDGESGDIGVVAAVSDERQARDILDGLADAADHNVSVCMYAIELPDSETDSLTRDEIHGYFFDIAARVVASGETPLERRPQLDP